MARGIVDFVGLQASAVMELRNMAASADLPFAIAKPGHVVLRPLDLKRSVAFYTQVLGFRVSDVDQDTTLRE